MIGGFRMYDEICQAIVADEDIRKMIQKDNVPLLGVSIHNLAEIKQANEILKSHGRSLSCRIQRFIERVYDENQGEKENDPVNCLHNGDVNNSRLFWK